ncbi:MAG: DEAD/DEAH box helicase [Planctomycetota bacterium]|nr:DEAD/DEAH box helicase [Planctomycetota bacterium]
MRAWFAEALGEPTAPPRRGWPVIRSGRNVLIAAPTGAGKTLAAFLSAIDSLLALGNELPDETRVLYISPLKALGNDVQKNLQGPLDELRARDPSLPEVRALVRSGDTTQSERAAMRKRAPHILVTTPESLYILLTSESGRAMLSTVRTVIVDEIHAVLGDKRGSHLSLSLERLAALAGDFQRIGLSATQKPLVDVGRFLVGVGRECELVDEGHLRALDVAVEIPPSPLEPVCSHETWSEIYERIAELIREHRTTLVFVQTRKLSERIGAQLTRLLGGDAVACHHSSLAKERRLDAETRLKNGALRVLVATASLELGIDIGDVDLVVQVGTNRSIAAFLQRVGRAGHGVGRTPKGRLFPLTPDELVEAAALLRAVRLGHLDRTPQPSAPLDILAQQIVAACAAETWDENELFERLRRAWPYRDLERERFDSLVALHTDGRRALLHRDGVNGRLRGTRRARLTAITSGGAIPDSTQYQVVLEPEGTVVGTVDEDFAIEASGGDVFQLGNASWRVIRVERGRVRVSDAKGAPPSLPFWFGEAPARTQELSAETALVRERGVEREWLANEGDLTSEAQEQLHLYLTAGRDALGAVPTQERLVLERFFDESGGMQLVLHAPFGGRINRAFGLALRKRFCRHFGFELQAAANEDALVLSLGPKHSFPLEEVFDYLHPDSARDVLTQAILAAPMFETRWRWNATRSLLVERFQGGKKVPPPILRMRADDLLAEAFPQIVACGENLPPGDLPIPADHPIVAQTVDDCLNEAMDVDGFLGVLAGLRDGRIARVAIDTREPSPFARSVLSSRPYGFLDDAPLEERRTQAVYSRRVIDPKTAATLGKLDPDAVQRVREEAWPDPRDAEEVHEALSWMGYVTVDEARPWAEWIEELAKEQRIAREGDRWFAVEATRDPKSVLRGRMEALGLVHMEDPLLFELESEGVVLRTPFEGRQGWCDRRLLARIQRYTLERLRKEIEPVAAADFLRFLAAWQHVDEEHRVEGPAGVLEVVRQLAGFEAPAAAWERHILQARVKGYRPEWLDQLALGGEVAWGRLWGSGRAALRATPIALFPRAELGEWLGLSPEPEDPPLSWPARAIRETLERDGATFPAELSKAAGPLPSDAERGLEELISFGLLTSDSFVSLRQLLRPAWRRREPVHATGRWSLLRTRSFDPPEPEFVARVLLRRYGVVFRTVLERERQPIPWRDVARAYRTLELRGDVRGGRFVAGFSGEQYALPEAIPLLRRIRKRESHAPVSIAAADPLNLRGILTPDERVPSTALRTVELV